MKIPIEVQLRNLKIIIRQRKETREILIKYIKENINKVIEGPVEIKHIRDKINMGNTDFTDTELVEITEYLLKDK